MDNFPMTPQALMQAHPVIMASTGLEAFYTNITMSVHQIISSIKLGQPEMYNLEKL